MITKEFRVFDPAKGEYIKDFYINGKSEVWQNEGVGCWCLEPVPNAIVEIWTGRYDDLQTKIWENDIIEVDHYYNSKKGFRDVVGMHDEEFCLVFDGCLGVGGCDKIKVIGNCHFNADLLVDCEWLDRRKDGN